MSTSKEPYAVETHRTVDRFLRRHAELNNRWESIRDSLETSPKRGGKIVHMKGVFQCNHRWMEGRYRFVYEVRDDQNLVYVFYANTRGDAY